MTNQRQSVKLTMTDLDGQTVERTIDISNLSRPDYSAPNGWECNKIETEEEKQIKMINKWIDERGNEQHDTLLTLVSFEIV